jgi:hypothetical protein
MDRRQRATWCAFCALMEPVTATPVSYPRMNGFQAMAEWLQVWFDHVEWNWTTGLWSLALVVVGLVLSNLVVVIVLVKLPATYFIDPARSSFLAARHPVVAWAIRIVKNLLGIGAVLLGLVLSLPAIPGPGLLLVLIGIMLLEFPGKRRLERSIVARPRVYRGINALRKYFGQVPLRLDE